MNPFSNFDMIGNIASSTSGYIANFAPIFTFMAGLLIAMAVIAWLIGLSTGRTGRQTEGVDDRI